MKSIIIGMTLISLSSCNSEQNSTLEEINKRLARIEYDSCVAKEHAHWLLVIERFKENGTLRKGVKVDLLIDSDESICKERTK